MPFAGDASLADLPRAQTGIVMPKGPESPLKRRQVSHRADLGTMKTALPTLRLPQQNANPKSVDHYSTPKTALPTPVHPNRTLTQNRWSTTPVRSADLVSHFS